MYEPTLGDGQQPAHGLNPDRMLRNYTSIDVSQYYEICQPTLILRLKNL